MDLKLKLQIFSFICQEMLYFGIFSYLIIVFTKRKIGADIALPIKGNVHLLFHNVLKPTTSECFVES